MKRVVAGIWGSFLVIEAGCSLILDANPRGGDDVAETEVVSEEADETDGAIDF